MIGFITGLMDRSPPVRRLFNRVFYQYLASLDRDGEVILMNYGYAGDPIPLDPSDEDERLCIQLYHHVASAIDLTGLDVLEVGSGRGGGASYVTRYLNPASVTGVDFAQRSVDFSRHAHQLDGLRFMHGDAENLPFAAEQFDAVINVESSHCYGSMPRFLSEVYRVLRSGGHFLWADFRPTVQIDAFVNDVEAAGLRILEQEPVTTNVLGALDALSERNRERIERAVPKALYPLFYRFAALDGTELQEQFESGELAYLRINAQKPARPSP